MPAWQKRQPRVQPRMTSSWPEFPACTSLRSTGQVGHELADAARVRLEVGGDAGGDLRRRVRVERLQPIEGAAGRIDRTVERRDVHAGNSGQLAQSLPAQSPVGATALGRPAARRLAARRLAARRLAVGAGSAVPGDRLEGVADLQDHLLALPHDHRVEEVRQRLRIQDARSSGHDQRLGFTPLGGDQADPAQIEHVQQVRVGQLVAEADPQDVEVSQRPPSLDAPQRQPFRSKSGLKVDPGA
jgi:hypothetical protein